MKRQSIQRVLGYFLPVLLFSAMMVWLIIGLFGVDNVADEQELENVKSSIEKGVTMCYAIEGKYPDSIEYLRDNYGIVINEDKYIVHYECFADNIRPAVSILERV